MLGAVCAMVQCPFVCQRNEMVCGTKASVGVSDVIF